MDILVYVGKGASSRSFRHLHSAMAAIFPRARVSAVTGPEILAGALTGPCRLLCFPGGGDKGFLETLGRRGCELIRRWVEAGGVYFGICAGAYFGANVIEFDRGGRFDVCAERFLKFYPGVAHGPAFPGYQPNTEEGSLAARIRTAQDAGIPNMELSVYANGTPWFSGHGEDCPTVTPLLFLDDGRLTAVRCEVGRGTALLVGPHIEYDPLSDPKGAKDPLLQRHMKVMTDDNGKRIQLFTNLLKTLPLWKELGGCESFAKDKPLCKL